MRSHTVTSQDKRNQSAGIPGAFHGAARRRTGRGPGFSRLSRGGAFTLLEIITAVAIGLIIILIVAGLFRATGDTVAVGKRVSSFNRTAGLMAQQMRDDFRSMTRDGFLVIRHGFVTDSSGRIIPVPASPDDTNPRARRADEIVFFGRGGYTSLRAPMPGGSSISATDARIYYGHGASVDFALAGSAAARDAITVPRFDLGTRSIMVDPAGEIWMGPLGGVQVGASFAGANATASNWPLLRHVTLLAAPGAAFPEGTPAVRIDGVRQIGLQPAMPSVFRAINLAYATPPTGEAQFIRNGGVINRDDAVSALAVSGLLDIASTSLREIRLRVTSSHDNPPAGGAMPQGIPPRQFTNGNSLLDPRFQPKGWMPAIPLPSNATEIPDGTYLDTMHAWMRQALPADSDGEDRLEGFGPRELEKVRMRADRSPPGLREVLLQAETNAFLNADRLSDQNTLTGSLIAPAVTDFMIEWSYGLTDASGQFVWYGGSDFTGATPANPLPTGIRRYGSGQLLRINRFTGETLPSGIAVDPDETNQTVIDSYEHRILPELIHGTEDLPGDVPAVYSYFGYADPSYRPILAGQRREIAWPWPKLIRVSFTLADPEDPSAQQQYQYVFETGR